MTEIPVEVDTSLLGGSRQATGTAVDASIDMMMPTVSAQDFSSMLNQPGLRADAFSAGLEYDVDTGTASGTRGKVLDFAKQFVGRTPYVWGGTSPSGFDCSGLLQYSLGKFGIHIPRVAAQQAGVGKRVNIAQLQPGDFVVKNDGSHIAFYLGGGQILEAPRTGLKVRIRKLGAKEGYYGVHIRYPGE